MLIGIDGNEANIHSKVGIGQYAFNLLTAINQIDRTNNYIIYLKSPPNSDLPVPSRRWQYRVFGPPTMWTQFALPLKLFTQKEKLNLFFTPSHYSPRYSPFPTICSIMDLSYLHLPGQFTKKDLYQLVNWTKNSVQKAAHIVTISQFSKNEISHYYHIAPNKISIAYPGVSRLPPQPNQIIHQVLSSFKIDQPYFLYLGTLKPTKNIPFLIETFSQFVLKYPNFKLVISGKKGWLFQEIFKTVNDLKIKKSVIFTDYISDSEKYCLLKMATSLIIPSTYEGFGIPAIEAMALKTPVIASNTTSLPEVVKNHGLLINPTDQRSLLAAMEKFASSKPNQLIKKAYDYSKQFTWNNAAQTVISTFNRI